MPAPASVRVVAIPKLIFRARTQQIIQPDPFWPLAEFSTMKCDSTDVSQHTTYDLSIQVIPSVVTDRTPFGIEQDSHSPFSVHSAADQTNYYKMTLWVVIA